MIAQGGRKPDALRKADGGPSLMLLRLLEQDLITLAKIS